MKWKNRWSKYVNISLMTLFVIFWLVLFILYNPNEIIKNLGIEQVYLTLFLLGILGALTSLTSVSIYPAIATFLVGGANPYIVWILSGIALTIGDTFFFAFGHEISKFLSKNQKNKVKKFFMKFKKKENIFRFLTYFYVAFTPLPNNIFTAVLAINNYPYKKLFAPLFLGNMTLPLIIILLTIFGISLF